MGRAAYDKTVPEGPSFCCFCGKPLGPSEKDSILARPYPSFLCPKCGCKLSIPSDRDWVVCTACGRDIRLTKGGATLIAEYGRWEYGELVAEFPPNEFEKIIGWKYHDARPPKAAMPLIEQVVTSTIAAASQAGWQVDCYIDPVALWGAQGIKFRLIRDHLGRYTVVLLTLSLLCRRQVWDRGAGSSADG